MWDKIAARIVKLRFYLFALILLLTVLMGLGAMRAEMSYDFAKAVPENDPDMVYFEQFKKKFGIDDNTIIIGIKDSSVTKIEKFREYERLSKNLAGIKGVANVTAIPTLQYIRRGGERQLVFDTLFKASPDSQTELDSLLGFASELLFYKDVLFNDGGAWAMLVTFEEAAIRTAQRADVKESIDRFCDEFTEKTGIKTHKAGVQYLRAYVQKQVKTELNQFLLISIVVSTVILYLFFRSLVPTLVPLLLIGVIVIWTMGTLGWLGYKITALTGLLPSILVVIAVPNCIYLTTKFHQKCVETGSKIEAIYYMVSKIGLVTLLTNATTAVGFLVLISTRIDILAQFGIVAGINIFATFVISLIFLPVVFSILPLPEGKATKHIKSAFFNKIIDLIWDLVATKRKFIYGFSLLFFAFSIYGVTRINTIAFMADDLPSESPVVKDIRFFEENFGGVMPFEIVLDLGKNYALRDLKLLKKIDSLQTRLHETPEFTKPLSIVELIKTANHAFGNFYAGAYEVPNQRGFAYLSPYLSGRKGNLNSGTFKSLTDTAQREVRISVRVADVGSVRLDTLVKQTEQMVSDIFQGDSAVNVKVTGTTLLFVKGNDYLVANLKTSLLLACAVIALLMGLLFRRLRIITIALLPNILPMLFTAGMMGYLGVALKPSTALIFSIAFGISVDDTIHFLAKYRIDLGYTNQNVPKALQMSLRETGLSMIYTSLVLFAGFIILTASEFGGTIALGALTSTTLIVAMFSNLVLLPSLLFSFDKSREE
jgi:predicted RND superfamily exporter protein